MAVRVGINGFGRIGRNIFRAAKQDHVKDIDFVAVNDITDAETLAHLLKYDSVLGKYPGDVKTWGEGIEVDGDRFKVLTERDPANLPWKDLGVDVVIESTGLFLDRDSASKHLKGGAKKVVISAPAKNPDFTIALGVNQDAYQPDTHHIISNASCTTNCLAPVAKVLLEEFGIRYGLMTTIHSYTNDQRILDLPHSDLRRARAAALSMIPTTTGAAAAVSLVLPALKGKLDGMAIRVPTPNVSLVDLVVELEQDASTETVNDAFKKASDDGLKGILGYSELPLVSIDFSGNSNSSIVDGPSTMMIGNRMVKVLSWYDNEWAYSLRCVELAKFLGAQL